VVSLDQSVLPDEERLLAAKDESQLDEVMATERHLLYVAATRARDHLWLSGMDPVSEFVTDLMGRVGPSKS
jgi:ATP-dependent exoDNAse (exonuclease V) beta subunit